MSTSLMPKRLRKMFRSRKKREEESTDTVTYGGSTATDSPDALGQYDDIYQPAYEDTDFPLAVALSESAKEANEAQSVEGMDINSSAIRYKASYSNGPSSHSEALSSSYYKNGILEYDEHITDGFYDVWGEFNEVLRGRPFPSLKALKRFRPEDEDLREVVLLNRNRDTVIPMIEEAAREAMLKLMDCGRVAIIQALAQIVSAQMGGAVPDERALVRGWKKCSQKLKKRYRSAVYPIGKLRVGLSRHRAFLYKVLADGLNLGCRLARGLPYRHSNSLAVALVMIDNEELIVDLLHEPGRLMRLEGCPASPTGYHVSPTSPSTGHRVRLGGRGSRRYQSLPENTSVEGDYPHSTYRPHQDEHPRHKAAQLPPRSAFYYSDQTPFDSAPGQYGSTELPRDDSSALSSGHRQNSDASTTSSGRVGMNTQLSATSAGSNGWPEEIESPRVVNRPLQGSESQCTASRMSSNNFDETKPSQIINTPENPAPVGFVNPPVMFSAFQMADLPKWEDSDDGDYDVPIEEEQPESPPKPTLTRDDSMISSNEKATIFGSSINALYDADHNVLQSEIELESVRLGVGSYGEVFKGTWRGTEVAVKRLLEQEVSSQMLEEFLYEVKIMKCLRHPNVLLFMGACMQPPNLAIVTEYLPRGSLYKLIHKTDFTNQKLKLRMARDVAKGMCYLHSFRPPIVHRDLKSPNLLVDKDWRVKVCDFGMSRMKANTYLSGKGASGTPEWMAPEVLRNEKSDEKCDVYSFGVILYELVTGLEPWPNLKPMQVVGAVGYAGQCLPLPRAIDPKIASIIKQCWSREPGNRPSFSDLLKMLSEFDSLPCLPKQG